MTIAHLSLTSARSQTSDMTICLPNLFDGFRHLHLTSYFLQERLRPDFPRLIREAKAAGLTVSFDPNSDPSQGWSPEIWEVMRSADVVFVNEQEAQALTGDVEHDRSSLGAWRAHSLCRREAGQEGATAVRGAERVHLEAFRVNAVDTTGAGDSFAAGFVHGLLTKRPLRECLLLANATGALSATGVGGTAAQPDRETLSAFLRSRASFRCGAQRMSAIASRSDHDSKRWEPTCQAMSAIRSSR